MTQPPDGPRGGATFDWQRDYDRLNAQMRRVFEVMRDWRWHLSTEWPEATGDSWASAQARLRDFRKVEFGGWRADHPERGGWRMHSECVSRGLWRFRLEWIPPAGETQEERLRRKMQEQLDQHNGHH